MNKNLFLLTSLLGFGFAVNAQMGNFSSPVRLASGINTEAEETLPIFSADSSTLYFSRVLPTGENNELNGEIWFSSKENGEFLKSEPIDVLNNKSHNAIFGVSKEGSSLYVLDSYDKFKSQGKKNYFKKGAAISMKKGNDWQTPIHVEIPTLDIEGDAYGFYINGDENSMIVSYQGPGSLGKEDLYVITKEGSAWSAPVHMGNVINTTGFEISPFLSVTKDTLYFSSNGLGGSGDADIFYSTKQGSWIEWSAPVNLGSTINSPKFDGYFTYSNNKVYWASNRESENSDIYYATILPPPPPPPLLATAVGSDVTVYQGSDGNIDLTIEGGVTPYDIIWSNNSKKEDPTNLKRGSYTVIITDDIGQTAEVTVEINQPKPPITNVDLIVNPIYFDFAKSIIRKDAAKELDKIIKIMNDNPEIEIELGSHTDCRASDEYNMLLSTKRAKASALYIKERITKPERINGKGYGETRLIAICDCESSNKKLKCTEKQNQLNRRTEFVLRKEGDERYVDITTVEVAEAVVATERKVDGNETETTIGSAETSSIEEPIKQQETINKSDKKVTGKTVFKTNIPISEDQAKNIKNGFYITQEGETLYRVFVNTKIPLEDLRRLNGIKNNIIAPGTKLLLR